MSRCNVRVAAVPMKILWKGRVLLLVAFSHLVGCVIKFEIVPHERELGARYSDALLRSVLLLFWVSGLVLSLTLCWKSICRLCLRLSIVFDKSLSYGFSMTNFETYKAKLKIRKQKWRAIIESKSQEKNNVFRRIKNCWHKMKKIYLCTKPTVLKCTEMEV